jgi:predicted nuclease with TOPRIM domain
VIYLEDEVFELLTKMYSEMTEQFKEVKSKLDKKADKSDIVRMENELNPKVKALFDGYKQHTDILERIEKEVTRQDEIIMRRIK